MQTQETPLHYCARAGNADIMLEIVKHIGPSKTQSAVNKQAKVGVVTLDNVRTYFEIISFFKWPQYIVFIYMDG